MQIEPASILKATDKSEIFESDMVFGENQSRKTVTAFVETMNEYQGCIAMSLDELGYIYLFGMDIQEIEGSKPIGRKPTQLAIRKVRK